MENPTPSVEDLHIRIQLLEETISKMKQDAKYQSEKTIGVAFWDMDVLQIQVCHYLNIPVDSDVHLSNPEMCDVAVDGVIQRGYCCKVNIDDSKRGVVYFYKDRPIHQHFPETCDGLKTSIRNYFELSDDVDIHYSKVMPCKAFINASIRSVHTSLVTVTFSDNTTKSKRIYISHNSILTHTDIQ